jgi:hypothetical protein
MPLNNLYNRGMMMMNRGVTLSHAAAGRALLQHSSLQDISTCNAAPLISLLAQQAAAGANSGFASSVESCCCCWQQTQK